LKFAKLQTIIRANGRADSPLAAKKETTTMIISLVSFKGGVGKTTTAIHLAAFLQRRAPTVLVDGDLNRACLGWAQRGQLPFDVIDERQTAKYLRDHTVEHTVIDTGARPAEDDLKVIVNTCDLMVIPTTPNALSLEALLPTVDAVKALGVERFKVLITMIPPYPRRDGEDARTTIDGVELPVFRVSVPRLVAYEKAALHGLPVYDVRDRHAGDAWQVYEQVAKEALKI
jgi:chromosome partitioning protein